MNEKQAKDLLDATFNKQLDKENYTSYLNFLKELLNKSNFYKQDKTPFIAKQFKDYILKVTKLGDYRDSSNKSIEILAVKLAKHSSLDRARTMQRNFISTWLSKNANEPIGALVAFYSDEEDWRFSFVKLEYNLLKDEKGNLKAQKELTPAKRYSFLVGPHEPNHTCRSQFVHLLIDDHDPTLVEIEKAFGIEKVTKEFFEKYKKRFLELKESLVKVIKKDSVVKEEFMRIVQEDNGRLDTFVVEFSKKLLGQIVFLYFLQKKGWLGVQKEETGKFKKWGTGPKDFMRRIFNKEYGDYKNFFNDILEPLFYNTLAVKRPEDYSDKFNCKIPFLNGGLFKPLDGYDWINTNINLDDNIFREIFDTFDEFNFTVKEDEPLEKEVAVDPEMLGKVFENLLDVIDRKSKGAFYTPREIVHYMCQQSLINYLETNTSIAREDIEKFIEMGDATTSNDERILIQIEEKKIKFQKGIISADIFAKEVEQLSNQLSLPKSIVGNKEQIDKLLKDIKVVDPAVGSGAFPVGMMNEIVKARSILSRFFSEERNIYDIKRECIEDSLYGVDIMPSAVDICQLRFWLSLIVDEDDKDKVKPLPNLDNKIMCGNSLLEEFEGVKLFDDSLLGEEIKDIRPELEKLDKEIAELNAKIGLIARGKEKGSIKEVEKDIRKLERKKDKIQSSEETGRNLTLNEIGKRKRSEAKIKLKRLEAKQKEFFNSYDRDRKAELKKEIDKLEWELIKVTLEEQGNEEALERLDKIMRSKSKPFFLWKLNFAEVFQEKGGFDVVIGNPPYGFRNVLTKEEKEHFRKKEKIDFKSGDSAELFSKKCFDTLLREGGVLTFIIPKKSLYGDSWEGLRIDYWKNYNLLFVLDSSKAFESVLLEASAFALQKRNQKADVKLSFLDKEDRIFEFSKEPKDNLFVGNNSIQIYFSLYPKEMIEKILSRSTNESLVEGKLGLAIGRPFYSEEETEYKLLKGIDVAKWNIKSHRYLKNKEKLNWNKAKEFLKPKVIAQRIVAHIENPIPHIKLMAAFDHEGILITNTLMSFRLDERINEKFWLGYINSKFISWYTYNFIYSRAIRTMDLYNFYIRQIAIPHDVIKNQSKQLSMIELVDQILYITKEGDYLENPDKQAKVKRLEKEIDQLVYKLYDLTPEEIKIVEGFNGK